MTRHLRSFALSMLLSWAALLPVQEARAQCTAPTSTVVNNTNCAAATGKITFTGPVPTANYQFSIDGGVTFGTPGQTVFTGLFGGSYATVSKLIATGCVSAATAKTITNPAVPANPASGVVNNTNCSTPNGSITFTAPTPLANYAFSVNGGATFGAPGVVSFPGLQGGTYPTVVRNVATSCVSATTSKTITNPAIAAPVSTVTAATNCITPNGAINFTAQAGVVFGIDGGATFGTAGQTAFPNLSPGTYVTRAKVTATGCLSAAANKTVAAPVVTSPASTVVNVTNCIAPNGSITFTAPTPLANYQFSTDGGTTFGNAGQAAFTGLTAGAYQTVAKLVSSGCVSATVNKTVASQAVATPASTVTNVTNCTTPNGRITFTGPTPLANYRFSVDGGTTFGTPGQTAFPNLAAGNYSTVAQLVSSGCISPTPAAKVIANPAVTAPTSTVAPSSCSTATGSITFTGPTPLASFSFSVDGGTTFGTPGQTVFNNLPAGTYVTKSRSAAGCVSAASTNKVITNTVTTAPTTAAGTNPTNCNTPNGAINFTGPTALANYEFSIDGGANFGAAGVVNFPNLAAGTYATKARSVLTGCVSATVNKTLSNPVVTVPTASKTDVTDCASPDGSITFTGPTPIGNYQYSIDGGTTYGFTGQVFFGTLPSGTYSPVCRLVSSGCESNPAANLNILRPARAGGDKEICQYQPAIMTAAALGGATWDVLPGNPAVTTFVNAAAAGTRINGFTVVGTYQFAWGTAACKDTVTVVVDDCLSPLVNNTSAYLYQSVAGSATDIISVNLGTGAQSTLYTDVNISAGNINAVGYNVTDGEIWGSVVNGTGQALTGDSIARIGEDGIPHYYVVPGLYSGGYNVGTVDNDGVLYLYSSNQTQIFRVDVNPTSPTFLTLLAPVLNTTAMNIADWAFNPMDGLLYGVGNGNPHPLYRVNPTTGTVTTVGNVTGNAAFTAGSFGAAYMDASGNLYVGDNTAGGVFKINTVHNVVGNTTAALRSQGQPSAGNDGTLNHNSCVKPDAGRDTMICISTYVTMTASQVSGVQWSAQGDNPGTATITNPANANTTITDFSQSGLYHFIWTNGPDCTDTVAVRVINCISDTLVVPPCDTCPVTICNTPNPELPVTDTTTHSTCGITPAGSNYGTLVLDASGCATWTPNGTQPATDTVTTCITSCNGPVCDTTYVLILPPPTPLPLELIYFKGAMADCRAYLTWQTAKEDLKDMTIERSAAGSKWTILATVPALGRGLDHKDYQYVDLAAPQGRNLYRLKMTDADGAFRYSPVVSLHNSCMDAVIAIFPNPAREQEGITIKVNNLDEVVYQLFDQTGKMLREGRFAGQTEIKGLKAGVYFVKASNASVNISRKVIIR
ncbi:DUF6923 family protein [Taibaiella koreensis]|uniref:DUF6923 family protein n=1 Tax=Taibaiella koreensis TaxID=1268548 RepID=UPI000E59CF9B|nr:T9SS type A sorting domain-containing protein [Taibaiella koreensis]